MVCSVTRFPRLGATRFPFSVSANCDLGDPKAAILLVHGFTWHSGYFAHLTEELAAQGVAVVCEALIHILAQQLFAFAQDPQYTTSAGTIRFMLSLSSVAQAFLSRALTCKAMDKAMVLCLD